MKKTVTFRLAHLFTLLLTCQLGIFSPAIRANEGAITKISRVQLCTPHSCDVLLFHLRHYGNDFTLSSGEKCDVQTLTRAQFDATRAFFAERGIDPFSASARPVDTPRTAILLEVDPIQRATATAARRLHKKSGYENAQAFILQHKNFFLGFSAHAGCPRMGNAVLDCFDNRAAIENYLTTSTNVLGAATAMKDLPTDLGVHVSFAVQTNAAMLGARQCALDTDGLIEQDRHQAAKNHLPDGVLFAQWFAQTQATINQMLEELAHLCHNRPLVERVRTEVARQAEAIEQTYAAWSQVCDVPLEQFPIQYGPLVFRHLDRLSKELLQHASDAVYQFPRAYADLNLLVTTLRHARDGHSTIIIPAGGHHTQRAVEWLSLLPGAYVHEESQELLTAHGGSAIDPTNPTRVLERLFGPLAQARLAYARLPERMLSLGRPLQIYAPTTAGNIHGPWQWHPAGTRAAQIRGDAEPAQPAVTPPDTAQPATENTRQCQAFCGLDLRGKLGAALADKRR